MLKKDVLSIKREKEWCMVIGLSVLAICVCTHCLVLISQIENSQGGTYAKRSDQE